VPEKIFKKSLAFSFWLVYNTSNKIEKGEIKMIDRSEVSRALAKAIAYKNCGKDKDAEEWAKKLVELLECAKILK
jgi:hypothetical protein